MNNLGVFVTNIEDACSKPGIAMKKLVVAYDIESLIALKSYNNDKITATKEVYVGKNQVLENIQIKVRSRSNEQYEFRASKISADCLYIFINGFWARFIRVEFYNLELLIEQRRKYKIKHKCKVCDTIDLKECAVCAFHIPDVTVSDIEPYWAKVKYEHICGNGIFFEDGDKLCSEVFILEKAFGTEEEMKNDISNPSNVRIKEALIEILGDN